MSDAIKIDAKELQIFYKALGKVDPELRKALRRNLTNLAKPIVQEVKRAAVSIPSKGGDVGGTRKKKGATLGFRASLANATKADFATMGHGAAVHIRVSSGKFIAASGRPRTLPYYMEGRRKREWRHPVYGNDENWVSQKPHPFLFATVRSHKDAFEKSCINAVNDILDQIDSKVN
jgi:hypothetical protein